MRSPSLSAGDSEKKKKKYKSQCQKAHNEVRQRKRKLITIINESMVQLREV